MIPDINYSFIAAAESFYEGIGYKRIPPSWTAPKSSIETTKPANKRHFPLYDDQCLVGSGEQSFIDLILRGEIGEGWFFGTTPCFRDDAVDELNGKYFLKVELARIFRPRSHIWDFTIPTQMAYQAQCLFHKLSSGRMPCEYKVLGDYTEECKVDLESKSGIELGSYGLRRIAGSDKLLYYGTGLAEPRFSYALRKESLTSRAEVLGSKP